MILCVCNGLKDREVLAAARACGTTCPTRAYAELGCRPQCGQCLDHAAMLIEADQQPLLLAAE